MEKRITAGIDVSSEKLDIYFNTLQGEEKYLQLPNTLKGHQESVRKVGAHAHYVMECTGPYYLRLACYLAQHGIKVSAENATQVKRYIQMHNERNKSDKKDAR